MRCVVYTNGQMDYLLLMLSISPINGRLTAVCVREREMCHSKWLSHHSRTLFVRITINIYFECASLSVFLRAQHQRAEKKRQRTLFRNVFTFNAWVMCCNLCSLPQMPNENWYNQNTCLEWSGCCDNAAKVYPNKMFCLTDPGVQAL